MRKILTIVLLLFIFAISFSSVAFATADLNPIMADIDPITEDYVPTGALPESDTGEVPVPTTQTTPPATVDFFTPENILSIIIITIGVVLILLSVAILLRLKNV